MHTWLGVIPILLTETAEPTLTAQCDWFLRWSPGLHECVRGRASLIIPQHRQLRGQATSRLCVPVSAQRCSCVRASVCEWEKRDRWTFRGTGSAFFFGKAVAHMSATSQRIGVKAATLFIKLYWFLYGNPQSSGILHLAGLTESASVSLEQEDIQCLVTGLLSCGLHQGWLKDFKGMKLKFYTATESFKQKRSI